MPIVVNLDVMMARRHKGAGELAEEIGITPAWMCGLPTATTAAPFTCRN